jgi:hypothetical protein
VARQQETLRSVLRARTGGSASGGGGGGGLAGVDVRLRDVVAAYELQREQADAELRILRCGGPLPLFVATLTAVQAGGAAAGGRAACRRAPGPLRSPRLAAGRSWA